MNSQYDGLVYDLDGTLVRLDVDWGLVREDVLAVYERAGHDPGERDLWALFEDAPDFGLTDPVEDAIARHECEGARSSRRLPHADELVSESRPVAVCSVNCEQSVRLALEAHGLDDYVRAVVGRDTLATYKPHPEPLLTAIRGLGAGFEPSAICFVGDTERDAETAERAGTGFEWV
ncbi:HAD family hydrolase [Haloarchaeobius sp. DFWS5]|uniref:HAD family hydrolase n=1 Tax=Haloarchaeobius sp. DFWS5 TaxID=3446114 RepID=UPI003EBB749B